MWRLRLESCFCANPGTARTFFARENNSAEAVKCSFADNRAFQLQALSNNQRVLWPQQCLNYCASFTCWWTSLVALDTAAWSSQRNSSFLNQTWGVMCWKGQEWSTYKHSAVASSYVGIHLFIFYLLKCNSQVEKTRTLTDNPLNHKLNLVRNLS